MASESFSAGVTGQQDTGRRPVVETTGMQATLHEAVKKGVRVIIDLMLLLALTPRPQPSGSRHASPRASRARRLGAPPDRARRGSASHLLRRPGRMVFGPARRGAGRGALRAACLCADDQPRAPVCHAGMAEGTGFTVTLYEGVTVTLNEIVMPG